MLRRLHHEQPESFAFTEANLEWAKTQIAKYPEGRQASAVIPLLWRAQEQEGWISRPIIETVAKMLDMANIRVLEVASFYFMFQMAPVGRYNVQVCGTTTCMICGAEDLIAVCKEKIGPKAHTPYRDGLFSWEEVECLGACANAPMVQIGKDFYEDLTAKRLGEILDELAAGRVPTPGPQNGRYASEPKTGLTALIIPEGESRNRLNASVQLATALEDGQTRIQGTEPVASASVINSDMSADAPAKAQPAQEPSAPPQPEPEVEHDHEARPEGSETLEAMQPAALAEAIDGKPDDLKAITGIGPAIETNLNAVGVFHYSQIAGWTDAEVAWIESNVAGAAGRPTRDDWRGQAKALADQAGGN
ncbi:NADH-quinone oxidoreductase subunit NuoE [Albimonas sp. CAU 1670]|uniref:NADH-quinone oxidoreductase subunit NuoE n=1 Tax=Albimonas sp. CAU 1670 TaxID=3032599 RepID=UPI0023DCB9EB|nr:NADH-quinone oxidoreductase subunit NuoE [Albimonas sp. CAU 1670]MDF2232682.1 NADH-quinone oxidoreductase subunit NuoE [Albimonas sp. CAU 1670]